MSLETLRHFQPHQETPPEINESVEEMMKKLKDIQSKDKGKAFLKAGDWLRNLHIEAMETGDFNYRLKAWQFCIQAENNLELMNIDPNDPSSHPKELPEQQQILASMAYYYHHHYDNSDYLNGYVEWVQKHRSHIENDKYKDPQLEEIRSTEFPKTLAKYEEGIWIDS